jgi:putative membrane protein
VADAARPRPSWIRTGLAALVGAALLAVLLWHTGLDPIVDRLGELGARGPLVLLPYCLVAYVDARGWRCTLPPVPQIPLRHVYFIRMAGEGVNSLTPAAAVGGEGVKVYLLRAWGVSGSDGLASVMISKTALTTAQSFFVILGLAALFDRLELRALGAVWLVVLLLALAGFTLGLMHLQSRAPAQTAWGWLHRLMPRARFVAWLRHRAAAVDERLAGFYHREGPTFWRASAWHLAGWLIGVLEVYLIMVLIETPIPLRDALIIEALAQPIRATALLIPGGLGTQEVGGVALCTFLGIPEPAGVTLWLLKRARELVFDGVGLLYLARHTARGSR